MKELIKQLESIKQDLIQGKIRQQIDHRLSRTIKDKIDKAINYTHCCKSDNEQLPNMTLEQAIEKAKPNMDKIKDVDKHIDNIR